jgi:hypothetical protein
MAAPNIVAHIPDHVPSRELGPSARGRILAGLFLLVIVLGIIGQAFIADRMIVTGDAAKTAANIRADRFSYQLAFSMFIVEIAAQIAVIALFYDLLKPVNRSVARLGAIMGFVGSGIKMLGRVFYYAPLLLLGGAAYLSAFDANQLATLSLVSIRINDQAAAIALVFFGVESLLEGWLIYRSAFLPRFLGAIAMIGGIGWLTYVWPPLGSKAFMFVALFAIVGVILTTGWLLIRGVNEKSWYERVALASASAWR